MPPSSRSRAMMALVSEGWETPQCLAARVKLRSADSARRSRIWCICMGSASPYRSRSRGSLPSTSAFDGEVVHRAALFVADVSVCDRQAEVIGCARDRPDLLRQMHSQRAFKGFASFEEY